MAQTADDRRIDFFRMRRDASRTPDHNTTHRVLSRGLEITQKEERACQSGVGSNRYRWVVLFLGQRVKSFRNLHCSRQLVSHQCMAPPTFEYHVEEVRMIKRVTQGLGTLVTNSGLG